MSNQWYPRYTSDYANDTQHLTMLEHGAYTLLMDYYYVTEKAIPANAQQLHRICRAFAPEEQEALQTVLTNFFQLEGKFYRHERIEQELEKRRNISEKRRNAANTKHANAGASAQQMHTQSQSESHPQLDKESGNDFLNFNQNFDLDMIIRDDTRQKVRDIANGWDLYALMSLFNEQVRSGKFNKPSRPDAAFLAWVPKFIKGKRP